MDGEGLLLVQPFDEVANLRQVSRRGLDIDGVAGVVMRDADIVLRGGLAGIALRVEIVQERIDPRRRGFLEREGHRPPRGAGWLIELLDLLDNVR